MIVFRADANETVATGHVMRCLTIAKACRSKGVVCEFWLAEDKEAERIRNAGFAVRILQSRWNDLPAELPTLTTLLEENKSKGHMVEYLVVDSYYATQEYLGKLNEIVPVLYIDDMQEQTYPVSAVLQYIPCGKTKRYQRQTNTVCLRGLAYTPLRQEFLKHSASKREKSILITTGGTDTYRVAERVLRECRKHEIFQEYGFHVILGSMNGEDGGLRNLSEQDTKIWLHKNVPNISDYMRKCELAVSAGGTTLLELCACGTPTVCFSFADNQVAFAGQMAQYGAVRYAGDARTAEKIESRICNELAELAGQKEVRARQADCMKKLVDGKGAERIADFLIKKGRENENDTIWKTDN